MGACRRVRQALEAQLKALRYDTHFNNHKWFRSEEASRDIGFGETLQSFSTSDYYQAFAEGFRRNYCRCECDIRSECDVESCPAETASAPDSTAPPARPAPAEPSASPDPPGPAESESPED
jgi:hypothetical protein